MVDRVDIAGAVAPETHGWCRDVPGRRVVADCTVHLTPREWERIEQEIRQATR